MTGPTDRREALCDWLRANGINPDHVPVDADLIIETDDTGQRIIRCDVFVTDAAGHHILDESRTRVAIESRTVPLNTEPPHWWQPHVKPTREQLLEAIGAALQLHRAAEHHGQTICVECSAYDGWTTTGNTPVPHPCATVKALGTP